MNGPHRWQNLKALLEERLAVIADHQARDRDPAAHLERLRWVSEAIAAEHAKHRSEMPARLQHFMMQASYQKALDWLREQESHLFSENA